MNGKVNQCFEQKYILKTREVSDLPGLMDRLAKIVDEGSRSKTMILGKACDDACLFIAKPLFKHPQPPYPPNVIQGEILVVLKCVGIESLYRASLKILEETKNIAVMEPV